MSNRFKFSPNPSEVIEYVEGAYRRGLSVNTEYYQQWLALGNTPDPADPPQPPPVVYKEKNSIITQLIQAGKMADARAILNMPGNEDNKDLWNGAYKIAYDDPSVRAMIAAVGMDAETVMSNATTYGG